MIKIIEIGVIAPINWKNADVLVDGINYIQYLQNIALFNPDIKLSVLNIDSIKENGTIQFYDFKKDEFGITNIDSFSAIHFFDFESSIVINETLDQKWDRIINKLTLIENRNILTLNSVKAIKYCVEKKYLLEYENLNSPFIQTDVVFADVQFEDLKNKYKNGRYIVKPSNGECGNYIYELGKLSNKDHGIITKQSKLLLVQPFQEEIYNGEFSLLFFRENFCHGVVKTPVNTEIRFPPKVNIKPYLPSIEEIEVGKTIFRTFPVKLDIFRLDFIKTSNGIKIMEIESVDPFHYVITNMQKYAQNLGEFYKMVINKIPDND
jgi:hypothetical protein